MKSTETETESLRARKIKPLEEELCTYFCSVRFRYPTTVHANKGEQVEVVGVVLHVALF